MDDTRLAEMLEQMSESIGRVHSTLHAMSLDIGQLQSRLGSIEGRMVGFEAQVEALARQLDRNDTDVTNISHAALRIEHQTQSVLKDTAELKGRLDRLSASLVVTRTKDVDWRSTIEARLALVEREHGRSDG